MSTSVRKGFVSADSESDSEFRFDAGGFNFWLYFEFFVKGRRVTIVISSDCYSCFGGCKSLA
jgi:hypothetical protein